MIVFAAFTAYQINAVNQVTSELLTLNAVEALGNLETNPGSSPIVCKWHQEICDNGNYRETCINDGNGSVCQCGVVTRPC